MKINLLGGILLLVAGVVGATCAMGEQAQPLVASPKDTAAIEALVAAEAEAWNHYDAKAFSVRFAQDGSFTNIIGTVLYGREAFERQHADIFASIYKDSTAKFTIGKLRFIRPDVAVADVDTTVTGFSRLPPGIQAGADGALHTKLQLVALKEHGQWWITAFHNVVVVPLPPRP
jgi:uncharacterized protein (TIGR02246 family)